MPNKSPTKKAGKKSHLQKTRKARARTHGKTQKVGRKRVFTLDNYNSGDGFITKVWGPALWHVLHTISFNYPTHPTEKNKQDYRTFMLSLKHVIPCKNCRKNLVMNFKKLPLTDKYLTSRAMFSKYVYLLHEAVNKMLNKKSMLSYADVRDRYEHFRARCSSKESDRQTTRKHRRGCIDPMYGKKSKCIIKIVPQDVVAGESIQIDKKCTHYVPS
jgi:hypothetical protein